MDATPSLDRETTRALVLAAIDDLFETQPELQRPAQVDDDLPLIGSGAAFDSIAFVALVADIEQRISEQHDLFLTLVDEKAMSMRQSPFRTLGTPLDHIEQTARDA